jgi:DNA-binding IclR family transcriptional regulator
VTESGGPEASSLQRGLTVLAQFEDERAVLSQTDIERMVGCSGSVAQQCLVSLARLGYLTDVSDGRYRLAVESESSRARPGEGGTLGTAA